MLEFLFWVVFTFIVIGYVFRLFLRYGLPWLLNRFMQKQQQKYSESNNSDNFSNSPDADTNIKTKVSQKKKSDNEKGDFGEYIEYEDVD